MTRTIAVRPGAARGLTGVATVVVLLVSLGLAGCGAAGSPAGTGPVSPGGTVPSAAPGTDASAFCAVVRRQREEGADVDQKRLVSGGGTPYEWRGIAARSAKIQAELLLHAPADIKDPVQVTSDFQAVYFRTLEEVGYDVTKANAALTGKVDLKKVAAAAAELDDYTTAHCGAAPSGPPS